MQHIMLRLHETICLNTHISERNVPLSNALTFTLLLFQNPWRSVLLCVQKRQLFSICLHDYLKKKLLRRNHVIFPKALSLKFTHLVSVVYNYLLSSATRIPFLVLWCLLVDIRRMGTWFISPVLPFFPFVHWRPSCLLTFVRLLYNVLFKAGFDDNEQFFTMFAYRETRKNSDNLEATKSFGILSRPTASFSSLDD